MCFTHSYIVSYSAGGQIFALKRCMLNFLVSLFFLIWLFEPLNQRALTFPILSYPDCRLWNMWNYAIKNQLLGGWGETRSFVTCVSLGFFWENAMDIELLLKSMHSYSWNQKSTLGLGETCSNTSLHVIYSFIWILINSLRKPESINTLNISS